ncbi:MAG TPA: FHA domain-containing protein [Gemmataceae bacterium]|jgi:tetratricopeptide (TPR) repeat protein|nr:FHA domain-containing protein [Gemmataceae bacterium]
MLGFAWLTLRQAQEALKNGRLEEAHRLLKEPGMLGQKGAGEILQQIARGFVERGDRHLRHEDPAGAWNDLLEAERTGVADDGSARLRQALVRQGLGDARALLDAGEPGRAAEALGKLASRGVQQAELGLLQEVARGWTAAQELAGRGEFAQALQAVERAGRLLPEPAAALGRFQKDLEQRGKSFSGLLVQLHEAADQKRWRDVLPLAERVLGLAPQHLEARKVRGRAWKSIEPATIAAPQRVEQPEVLEAVPAEPTRRYMLWVDGVGGYLICLGNRVTLGQATPETYVDVPLFADVSRVHAAVSRDSEGYLLEALRPTQVNGRLVDRALLQPGDRVTIGTCCQFQFGQPVPVSTTAQLDLLSGHRLPLTIDKVFLMADTVVLGPGPQAHVIMPDLHRQVVLFRQKDGLGVRYSGDLIVDGVPCRERAMLGPASRVTGDDFAFAVELLGTSMGRN